MRVLNNILTIIFMPVFILGAAWHIIKSWFDVGVFYMEEADK